jgi:uroporphyrinogen decarboxylase
MKRDGGYIFSSDHSIADSASLEDYRRIVQLVRQVGSYSS